MKKISLIMVTVAVILGGVSYYFTWKKAQDSSHISKASDNRDLKVHTLKVGSKQSLDYGMNLKINYKLYLVDKMRPDLKGKLIEERNPQAGAKREIFSKGSYLPGIEKAILQMTTGSEAWVFIPWELGYGDRSVGDGLVPAKHDLVAVINVLEK